MLDAPTEIVTQNFITRNSNLLVWPICIEFANENLEFLGFTILCKIKLVTQSEFMVCVYSVQRAPAEATLDRASWPWKLCQGRDKRLSVWTPQAVSQLELKWPNQSPGKLPPAGSPEQRKPGSTSHLHGLQHFSADSKLLKELFDSCHTTGTSLSHSACPSLTCHMLSKSVRKQPCESLA